jgi:hypothetical protein
LTAEKRESEAKSTKGRGDSLWVFAENKRQSLERTKFLSKQTRSENISTEQLQVTYRWSQNRERNNSHRRVVKTVLNLENGRPVLTSGNSKCDSAAESTMRRARGADLRRTRKPESFRASFTVWGGKSHNPQVNDVLLKKG